MSGRDGRDEARLRAAALLRAAIRRTAVDTFGATETHDPIPGYQVLARPVLDDDLAGVRAAHLAWSVAFGQMRDYAEQARAAGRSWDDVARVLGLSDQDGERGDGRPGGEQAFAWLIEGHDPDADRRRDFRSPPSARWTCAACGQRVTDRGPFEPHPDDNESGHDPTCPRQAAVVRAYERERGDS